MQSQACSIAEAAARAGVSRSTVYEEINRGNLKARKVGRRSIITEEDYRSWLDALPVVPAAALPRHGHPSGQQPNGAKPPTETK